MATGFLQSSPRQCAESEYSPRVRPRPSTRSPSESGSRARAPGPGRRGRGGDPTGGHGQSIPSLSVVVTVAVCVIAMVPDQHPVRHAAVPWFEGEPGARKTQKKILY
jgi:hypothetical protein